MRKLLLLLLFFHIFLTKGQCDLALTDVNIEEGTFTIEFINTENCGGDASPVGISEIQIGFQAIDPDNNCAAMNQGWTFPWGLTIPDDNAHPGWIYTVTSTEAPFNWTNLWGNEYPDIDPPYYTGETVTFPMYNQLQDDCINGPFANGLFCNLEEALNFWLDQGLSIQAVIWQISYGPTMYAADGGWAEIGANGDGTSYGTGVYEDENFEDNWLIVGPCAEQNLVEGCMDPIACNYNSEATQDDGSCVFCYTPYNEGLICNDYHDTEGYWDWYLSLYPDCEYPSDTIYIELPSDTVFVPTPADTVFTYIYQVDTILTYIETIDSVFIQLPADTIFLEPDTIYVELPGDTIYELDTLTIVVTEIDTLLIQLPPDTITLVEVDTLFIELPPDTITLVEVDTLLIELPPDTITLVETEFIFITDTIIETEYITLVDTTYVLYTDTVYVYEFIEIDCETGLPCSEVRNEECNVYIPNAFTPDNDGYNDAWEIVLDPECWTDVKAQVVNRWGNVVWESNDPNNLIWNGSYRGGNYYVQEEVYTWVFQARKIGTAEIKDLKGHVTVVR